jgi:poly(beta-D-mannuronate) lyase
MLHFRPALAVAVWLAVLVWAPGARAAERRAGDADELRSALQAARPGDVVVMKNGVWKDVAIDFRAEASAKAPVRLRAQTPGSVVLTGNSRLTFLAPHLIAEGLFFRDGTLTGAGSGGAVIRFTSHHGRLTDSAVVDYNPKGGTADGVPEYAWVHFEGDDNRVDHSSFRGKTNRRPVIANRPGARRNQVDRCHFKDIAFRAQNGREVIQIMGYGMNEELGSDGAFFTAERNLFEEAHGEAAEIISIKSNRNVVRFNTFRKTKGGVTNRSGNFNVIEGNFILGEGEPRSYGIRVTGQYHRVVNNQVVGVAGAGLLLVTGEFIDGPLTPDWQPLLRAGTPLGRVPRYAQVKHGLFARNRFIDCGGPAIEVGSAYKAGWPRGQQVLLPENNHLVENQIRQAESAGATSATSATSDRPLVRATRPDRAPPLDRFRFEPNQIEGNGADARTTAVESPGLRPLTPRDVGPRWLRQRWMATGTGP